MSANPEVLNRLPDVKAQKGLAANPGKTGEMFDDSHPYYAHDCAHCWAYGNKGLKNVFANGKKNCNYCSKMNVAIREITNDGYVVKTVYDNGGVLMIHQDVDKNKSDYHKIVNICQQFAKDGNVVKVNPRIHFKDARYAQIYDTLIGTKYERKCPDFSVNGVMYEFESYVRPWKHTKIRHMLSDGLKQSSRVVLDNTKGSSDRHYRHAILARLRLPNQRIDEVWLYEKGNARLFFKDGKFYKNNGKA